MQWQILAVALAAALPASADFRKGLKGHLSPNLTPQNVKQLESNPTCQFRYQVPKPMTCKNIVDRQNQVADAVLAPRISQSDLQALNPLLTCTVLVPTNTLVCVPFNNFPDTTTSSVAAAATTTSQVVFSGTLAASGAATGTAAATATATAVATSAVASSNGTDVISSAATSTITTISPEAPITSEAAITTQPAQAPQAPPSKSGDPCGDINAYMSSFGPSNNPSDVVAMHNGIRRITASYQGGSLNDLYWDGGVAAKAYSDAVYSATYGGCQGGGLAHDPDFGVVALKSLGWSDYISATKLFVNYDNGAGSECSQYFNYGVSSSHFGNIVAPVGSVGCGGSPCDGGSFGDVVGCDYA
ncbi:hypothetical protein BC830DRAFT_1157766 [Chytriomyces sp. MP71]|nr:hypothetical protein BC830DRAFT_1157766 [Chytriomyces sp. MP71]